MYLRGVEIGGTEYRFPLAGMEDAWYSARPMQGVRVSGAWGVYPIYGGASAPLSPLTVRKRFLIVASTTEGVETALLAWRYRTIAQPEQVKLIWAERGSGDVRRFWQYGTCTRFEAGETVREGGRFVKRVSLEFYVPEGFWRGWKTNDVTADYSTWWLTYINQYVFPVNNGDSGNAPMPLKFTLTPTTGDLVFDAGTTLTITSDNNGLLCTLDVGGRTLPRNQSLVIDALTYSVTFAGSDDYDNLTPESLVWLWVDGAPNSDFFTTLDRLTIAFSTGSAVDWAASFYGEKVWVF